MLEIDEGAEIALLETEWWVGFCLKKAHVNFSCLGPLMIWRKQLLLRKIYGDLY